MGSVFLFNSQASIGLPFDLNMPIGAVEIGLFLMSASLVAVAKAHPSSPPPILLQQVPSPTFPPLLSMFVDSPCQQGCPEERPDFNSPCGCEGMQCEWGRQECCGSVSPDVSMTCTDNSWLGFYIDTFCGFGYPCPE